MIYWLLAFLVHSTLWLGLAWLLLKLRPNAHARVRETVWHTAIAASLIAPSVQALVAQGSAWWSLPLPFATVSAAAGEHGGAAHREAVEHLGSNAVLVDAWQGPVCWAWLVLAGALLLRYVAQAWLLRRRLASRQFPADSPERVALTSLSSRAGLPRAPRITESENLGSPIAMGFGARAEICVPTRALHELDDEQFHAMLGHEVAHHMRRDPLRFGVLHLLRSVFFFQPLLGVAVRDVQLAAEEQCDAWGANHAEDRVVMASCLTEVATWVLRGDRRFEVVGMARWRSHLGVRVDRLLDDPRGFDVPGRLGRGIAAVALVGFAPWLTPTVMPSAAPRVAEREHGHREEQDRDTSRARSSREHDRGERRRDGGEHGERHHGDREHGEAERHREAQEHRSERGHGTRKTDARRGRR